MTDVEATPPSAARVLAATFAAAAAAPLPLLAFDLWIFIYVAGFVLALLHALLVGLPLYFQLNRTRRLTLVAALAWSFAVGAIPLTIVEIIAIYPMPAGPNPWVGSPQIVSDGVITLHGWFRIILSSGGLGVLGMTGGVAFWLVMRRHCAPRDVREPA